MVKPKVNIRLAMDSVLYAPLYIFQYINSENSNREFDFHLRTPSSDDIIGIKADKGFDLTPTDHVRLHGFAPLISDPVFDAVVKRDRFYRSKENDWFAVGDPVRLRRLVWHNHAFQYSYKIIGSLITRLGYWIVTEHHCRVASGFRYNVLYCHARGMTGFYISERLLSKVGSALPSNPLAPVKSPGKEIDFFKDIRTADYERRGTEIPDPVWLGAVSTEISKLRFLQTLPPLGGTEILSVHPVSEFIGMQPSNAYIMTCIIQRVMPPGQQTEIDRAGVILRQGVIDAIAMLHNDKQRFKDVLFQASRKSDSKGVDTIELQQRHETFDQYYDDLLPLYPYDRNNEASGLLSTKADHDATDALLREVVLDDVRAHGNGRHSKRLEKIVRVIMEQIGTASWDPDSELW